MSKEKKEESIDYTYPVHPTRIAISGPSYTGKTNLMLKLIKDPRAPWKCIHLFYAMEQPAYEELEAHCRKKKIAFDKHKDAPPANFMDFIADPENKKYKRLIIIDDLMDKISTGASGAKTADKLFWAGSHHCNATILTITQVLFANHTQRVNSDYIFLTNMNSDTASVRDLLMRMEPENWREVLADYREAMRTPFAWFLIDLKGDRLGHPELKYRTEL